MNYPLQFEDDNTISTLEFILLKNSVSDVNTIEKKNKMSFKKTLKQYLCKSVSKHTLI